MLGDLLGEFEIAPRDRRCRKQDFDVLAAYDWHFSPPRVFTQTPSHRACVEIQVRPSRKQWFPRTGAERTQVREHRKRREPPFAGRPHLNIDTRYSAKVTKTVLTPFLGTSSRLAKPNLSPDASEWPDVPNV
ncbi:MAG: hypothetical protein EOS78_18915 [Mesorhizobium sp.]|nr:MAG: hypothetical protein EOS78_18915 [Mesorhizobium sp.]